MVYEDLDAGDETRRNGDYVSFEHPDGDGTALSGVTLDQGIPVTADASGVLSAAASGGDVAGILSNYEVYGDTGQEEVGPEANVKMRGEVIADMSGLAVTVGSYWDGNADVFVAEEVDADNNLYRVQVR